MPYGKLFARLPEGWAASRPIRTLAAPSQEARVRLEAWRPSLAAPTPTGT